MKKRARNFLALVLSMAMILSMLVTPVGAARFTGQETGEAAPAAQAAEAAKPASSGAAEARRAAAGEDMPAELSATNTIWVVGDSTGCDYASTADPKFFYKRVGFGTALKDYVTGTAYAVNNLALSGRSSKSFLGEDNYTALKNGIKSGDVLIIAFGHNDEKSDNAKLYTTPGGTKSGGAYTAGSFVESLYTNYVKLAKDKGATPILCTPIVRRDSTNTYSDTSSVVHYANNGSYSQDIKNLGEWENVDVIDLTTITKEIWKTADADESANFHAWEQSKKVDNTHLNNYGAHIVAWNLAKEIAKLTSLSVAAAMNPGTTEPAKNTYLVQNSGWEEVAAGGGGTDVPKTFSSLWSDYVIGTGNDAVTFHGTVFGVVNGTPNTTDHTLEKSSDGNMHIAAKNNRGKLTTDNTGDGFDMYFYILPVGKSFTLSAKAKVNSIDANGQAGFGLIVRDNVSIDTNIEGLTSNYVAAGTFGTGGPAGFAREGGARVNGNKNVAAAPVAGDVWELSISGEPQDNVYTCEVNGVTTTFNFTIQSLDAGHNYIGMFATRNADITYSDIVLTVDGEKLCDTSSSGGNSGGGNEPGAIGRKVDVWDFGATEVKKAAYNDNITGAGLVDKHNELTNGLFYTTSSAPDAKYNYCLGATTSVAFGDLTMQGIKNGDRIYSVSTASGLSGLLGGDSKYFKKFNAKPYDAGTDGMAYTSEGGWYCNGNGNASTSWIQVDNVKAMDTLVVYAGSHSAAGSDHSNKYSFAKTDGSLAWESEGFGTAADLRKLSYIAGADGSYKIWQSYGSDKNLWQRVVRIPGVAVTGTVAPPQGGSVGSGWKLKFVNVDKELSYEADVDTDGKYSITLPVGVAFTAQLSGAAGLGLAAGEGKTKTLKVADAVAEDPTTWDLSAVAQSVVTGTITLSGFAQGYDLSNLKVVLTPENGDAIKVSASSGTATITAAEGMLSQVDYTVSLEGANDYVVPTAGNVNVIRAEGSFTKTITVQAVPSYAITGKFVTLDMDDQFAPLRDDATYPALTATVSTLKFKNLEDEYEYTATISNGGYSVTLRDGAYEAVATVSGYATKTHVVVSGKAMSRDLLFKAASQPSTAYAADVYVDPKATGSEAVPTFKTIAGAVNYVNSMSTRPTASTRTTVHIAPGTYREQVVLKTPFVSFVNDDPTKEVKLTWYYGVGYKYYSSSGKAITADTPATANANEGYRGFYDPERAFDKYSQSTADRWGCTIRITQEGFRAENITFENSLNYMVTDEEMADGATPSGIVESKNVVRNYKTDATSKEATERGAAIEFDGNNSEFYKCKFLSSQDTLYTGGTAYFKDCFIEGMTDYIFGGGNCVFDTCQLNWKGYSDKAEGGAITANKPNANTEKGYLLRNCTITAENNLKTGAGLFGRTWGGDDDATVTFLNTTFASEDLIAGRGWSTMSGTDIPNDDNTKVKEYGSALADGTAISTSGRPSKTLMTKAQAEAVNVTDWFGSWTPYYYKAEANTVEFVSDPIITTPNGDMNNPCYGTRYTVSYSLGEANDANDNSLIQWYRTKAGQADVLVFTSRASQTKDYRAVAEDAGFILKVKVTPETLSGKTAEAKTAQMEGAIQDTYYNPDAAGGVDIGEGINIYLAGDSTVKDYTKSNENLGSWGEWLQAYLGEGVTVANYANGGRSTRNFINEGKLKEIQDNIKAGDYLFVQFGHNDSANNSGSDYISNRYVPLGRADGSGVYPVFVGEKVATNKVDPSKVGTGSGKWGDTCYAWYSATYKGLLLEYVKVALKAGATPVLVTPVARMYYNTADGTIKAHHDETNTPPTSPSNYLDASLDPGSWTKNSSASNEYCKAVKQLYNELKAGTHDAALTAAGIDPATARGVLFIDGYAITEKLYKDAWKDAQTAGESDKTLYGNQIVNIDTKDGIKTDSTHSNKLGGLVEAALFAQAIQDLDIDISKAVKSPAKIQADTLTKANYGSGDIAVGTPVFSVNAKGEITAYDIKTNYTTRATYWEGWAATAFAAIDAKAAQLNPSESVELTNLAVNPATVEITGTGTAAVAVTATPGNHTDTLKAVSGNTGVATAVIRGTTVTITGVAPGTTTVTVSGTTATGVTAQIAVTVKAATVAPTEYTVTYVGKDDSSKSVNIATQVSSLPKKVESGTEVTLPDSLTVEGYTFVKWTKGGADVSGAVSITAATEFVANFTKNGDKTALSKKITAAEAAMATLGKVYTVADDAKPADVKYNTKYVTITDKTAAADRLVAAIEAANAVAAKAGATVAEVNSAIQTLTEAISNSTKIVKTGTKDKPAGGGSSADRGDTTPSKPDGTVTNADGSVTTVETKPDGSKVETIKEKDGTTTEIVTGKDGTVTATITEPDGAVVETVTSKEGDVAITVTDAEGETLVELELPATIPTAATRFEDVPEGHWAEASINKMAGLGVVKGVGEATFDMTSAIDRGSIATMLFRFAGGKEGKENTFADAKDHWASDAIGWASTAGIVKGYADGTFGPSDTITREQLAVMLYRMAKLLGMDTSVKTDALKGYKDASSVTWASNEMAWCVANGIINGVTTDTLSPATTATRAQTAVMMDRFIGLMK